VPAWSPTRSVCPPLPVTWTLAGFVDAALEALATPLAPEAPAADEPLEPEPEPELELEPQAAMVAEATTAPRTAAHRPPRVMDRARDGRWG